VNQKRYIVNIANGEAGILEKDGVGAKNPQMNIWEEPWILTKKRNLILTENVFISSQVYFSD